jgi:hypothetical protein
VAFRDFVAVHGICKKLQDVLKHLLILDAPDKNWKAWFAASDIDYKVRKCDRIFSDYDLSLMAAAEGNAVALLRHVLGNHLLHDSNLQTICDVEVPSPTKFYAVVQIGQRNRLIDRLVSHLVRECAKIEAVSHIRDFRRCGRFSIPDKYREELSTLLVWLFRPNQGFSKRMVVSAQHPASPSHAIANQLAWAARILVAIVR